MSHKTKAKAKGISTGSFFDLKAEISKQEADFAKAKAAGGSTSIVGGVKRPDKKPTVWARQNKGVSARSTRDIEQEIRDKPKLESARAVLERKAKIYEKLRKGKSGGLYFIQFDSAGPSHHYDSDSDDVDESLTVPARPGDDDPIVEYEDEFGPPEECADVPKYPDTCCRKKKMEALRIQPSSTKMNSDEFELRERSEVPRHLWPKEADPDADSVIYNPVGPFPRLRANSGTNSRDRKRRRAELNAPLAAHYDASKEVRAKGAGFYQFSADEETRKKQMDDLQNARVETEKAREEAGAMNLRPGEVEGMREGDTLKGTVASRAMEKRNGRLRKGGS
ncbi:hypothetical protein BKA70DRAFT_1218049 [Coprinopsis sp. MPI-PUGE-AT-0042]|nr:hypothetical protein BKA70DRAFT_1218049 [Coprinopsis sp. MPI-PUGE-AT-0042]